MLCTVTLHHLKIRAVTLEPGQSHQAISLDSVTFVSFVSVDMLVVRSVGFSTVQPLSSFNGRIIN